MNIRDSVHRTTFYGFEIRLLYEISGITTMSNLISEPVYRIETQRLVIRCYNPSDAWLLKASVDQSREHLMPWMPWAEGDPEDVQAYISRLRFFRGKFDLGENYIYGIFNKDEDFLIGGTGLHPRVGNKATEIGYWIHKNYINKGLASETTMALTKVAFEVCQMIRVEIHCDPDNLRSAAIPRKLGYTHDATLRKRLEQTNGTFRDTMIWSLLADEYPNSPSAGIEIRAYDAAGRRMM